MNIKSLLTWSAIFLLPVITFVGCLYAATFFPMGTFRFIEKNPIAKGQISASTGASTILGNSDGTIALQGDDTIEVEKISDGAIATVNKNGTVHVNNMA